MPSVFISHAGSDTIKAREVADALTAKGWTAVLDRNELVTGASFLSFMESSLSNCDYCLLLWSEAASQRKWVQLEWESALYRSMTEARVFLMVARLEDFPLPKLLAPRLCTDLYPDIAPGINELIQVSLHDANAAEITERKVSYPDTPLQNDPQGEELYITSELFGKTIPLKLSLKIPVGIHVNSIKSMLRLPDNLDIEGKLGCRFKYKLASKDDVLDNSRSLEAQGVKSSEVLWLQVEMVPFAAVEPTQGKTSPVTFRGGNKSPDVLQIARQHMKALIKNTGLGFD